MHGTNIAQYIGIFFILCPFFTIIISPASAAVIYIDQNAAGAQDGSSWANAFTTITAGLAASASSDEVWVKSATYHEAITMKEGVALYGGFPPEGTPTFNERDWNAHRTIIDASGLESRVVTIDDAEKTTLDGFTITGCKASGIREERYAGGLYYYFVNSATLANCTITGNSAYSGGGLFCTSSSPAVIDCTITGNSASKGGGVYCDDDSSPTLTHCTIADNSVSYYGGGVYASGSSNPTLTNCAVTGNSALKDGGGVYYACSSSPMLTGCTISGNQATTIGGGIYAGRIAIAIGDCTIQGNSAGNWGGGVFLGSYERDYDDYSNTIRPTLTNCTIVENVNHGLYCRHVFPQVTDCFVAFNVKDGLYSICNTIQVDRCQFINNSRYGAFIDHAWSSYRRCQAAFGGDDSDIYRDCSVGSFKNCVVAYNSGGIYCRDVTPRFINCTIAGNDSWALYYHMAIPHLYFEDQEYACCYCNGAPELINSIVSGNGAAADTYWIHGDCYDGDDFCREYAGAGGLEIVSSCVQGGWYGRALAADPRFVDPEQGDFRLQADSPCIDTGDNEASQDIDMDLYGNYRIWDGDGDGIAKVDMGAYEHSSILLVPGDTNGDEFIDTRDLFFFSRWWQGPTNETNFLCDVVEDATIDEQDLMILMRYWRD